MTSLVSKQEVQISELNEMLDKTFEGSVSAFIAAFAKQQNLSEEEIGKLRRIIDK